MSSPPKEKRAVGSAPNRTDFKLTRSYALTRTIQASLRRRRNRPAAVAELIPGVLAAMLVPSVARADRTKTQREGGGAA